MDRPSGWYRDPNGTGQLRYWSGSAWTAQLQTVPAGFIDPQGVRVHAPSVATSAGGAVVMGPLVTLRPWRRRQR